MNIKNTNESLISEAWVDAQNIAEEFYDYCKDNHLYLDDYDATQLNDNTIELYYYISEGDWKHEHLRSKWLLSELCEDKGYSIVGQSENAEDSDSDTYSAEHTVYIKLGNSINEDMDQDDCMNSIYHYYGRSHMHVIDSIFNFIEDELGEDVKQDIIDKICFRIETVEE